MSVKSPRAGGKNSGYNSAKIGKISVAISVLISMNIGYKMRGAAEKERTSLLHIKSIELVYSCWPCGIVQSTAGVSILG